MGSTAPGSTNAQNSHCTRAAEQCSRRKKKRVGASVHPPCGMGGNGLGGGGGTRWMEWLDGEMEALREACNPRPVKTQVRNRPTAEKAACCRVQAGVRVETPLRASATSIMYGSVLAVSDPQPSRQDVSPPLHTGGRPASPNLRYYRLLSTRATRRQAPAASQGTEYAINPSIEG